MHPLNVERAALRREVVDDGERVLGLEKQALDEVGCSGERGGQVAGVKTPSPVLLAERRALRT